MYYSTKDHARFSLNYQIFLEKLWEQCFILAREEWLVENKRQNRNNLNEANISVFVPLI